jgi:hypothetical protein
MQYNDGSRDCQNLGPFTRAAECIWALAKLLLQHGYTELGSRDGDPSSTPIDFVTYQGAGAGGLDRNNAWFWFTDGVRHIFIQLPSSASQHTWIGTVSISGGMAWPMPQTAPPTMALDEVGIFNGLGRSYAPGDASHRWGCQIFFNATFSAYCNCAVEDTSPGGGTLLPFWMQVWDAVTGAAECNFIWDAVLGEGGESPPPGVTDELAVYGGYYAPHYGYVTGIYGDPTNYMFYGWQNGEWTSLRGRYYYDASAAREPASGSGANPENLRHPLLPVFLSRQTGAQKGDRGRLYLCRWNPNYSAFLVGTAFLDAAHGTTPTADHRFMIAGYLALKGWFSAVTAPTF